MKRDYCLTNLTNLKTNVYRAFEMYWWLKCLPHTWRLEFKSPEPTQCCDGSNNLPAITALRKEKRDCWDKMASYRSQIDKPWVHWETQPKWRRWRVVKKGFPCQIWTSPGTGTHLDLYLLHICPHIHLIMHTHHARIGIGKKYLNDFSIFFPYQAFFDYIIFFGLIWKVTYFFHLWYSVPHLGASLKL